MQGETGVLDRLGELLASELTAIDQYFIHACIARDLGLNRLADHLDHETGEERQHAALLVRRLLFLEGHPDPGIRDPLNIGRSVPEMLRNDLNLEYRVARQIRAVIAHCEAVRDFETRNQLMGLLRDTEEDHVRWLEIQIGLIDQLGLANYLQSQR